VDVVVPLPLVEPGHEEGAAEAAEPASASIPLAEPGLLAPGKPAAIEMFERLFQPLVAEASSQYGSEVTVESETRTEDWSGLLDERVQDDGVDDLPQPLPPVDRGEPRPDRLSAVETDGKDAEPFDPRDYERCWSLELIAEEADKHARRGFELAGKKAYFSARLEFTRALRIIAQGLDTEGHTNRYSQALAAGLRALDEAEDFMPKDGHLEAELDLAMIAGAHRTPVLQGGDGEQATPLAAIQKYHTYAQEQLATAAGKEVAGSMALCGLGKLYMAIGDQQRGEEIVAARPKAMVLLQAALVVSPGNHMASNELGVLLARSGRHGDARAAFEHSVAAYPTAEGWRNLALTCERLGAMDEAYRAAQQTLALRGKSTGQVTPVGGSQGVVRWVAPADLASRGGNVRTASAARTAERAR
jgi:tetratricopeptide (TPR) repeat protein